MKIFILFMFLISLVVSAEPEDLTKVRKTYEDKQKELTISYVKWLKKRSEESRGEAYAAYAQELKIYESRVPQKVVVTMNNEDVVDTNWGKLIKIDATDAKGHRIGRLKEGQTIKIMYVSGLWSAYPDWNVENPDITNKRQHKIAFITYSQVGTTTISNPKNTSSNPYEYTIIFEGDYFLRMNDDLIDSNRGSVYYRIEIK